MLVFQRAAAYAESTSVKRRFLVAAVDEDASRV